MNRSRGRSRSGSRNGSGCGWFPPHALPGSRLRLPRRRGTLPRRRGEAPGAEEDALDAADVVPGLAYLVVGLFAAREAAAAEAAEVVAAHAAVRQAVEVVAEDVDEGLDVADVLALGEDVAVEVPEAGVEVAEAGGLADVVGLLGLAAVAGGEDGRRHLGADVAVEHLRRVLGVRVALLLLLDGVGALRRRRRRRGGDVGHGRLELADQGVELARGGGDELLPRLG